MAFTYSSCDGTNDQIDFVRLLVSDTQSLNHIFEDTEILGAYRIQQNVFQSSQFYSNTGGQTTLASSPVSYLRVAALLLDALAANKARLASIKQQLDIKLDASDASIQLRETAATYRQTDDDSGAFAIIEQVNDGWSFKDRWFKTFQRMSGGMVA